jgi:hypothetical protein
LCHFSPAGRRFQNAGLHKTLCFQRLSAHGAFGIAKAVGKGVEK